MIEINRDPKRRQVIVFGVLFFAFFGVVGALAWLKPDGLVGAASFLAVAWVISLVFNAENRLMQLLGVLIPALFAAAGGAVRWGWADEMWAVAGTVWALGALGAALAWMWPAAGRLGYIGWVCAAYPIGWSISHLLLAIIYYLVIMPIGLAMRLVGYDPLRRAFDGAATSYWIEHKPVEDVDRYFRQY